MRKIVSLTIITLLAFVFLAACAPTQPIETEQVPVNGYTDLSPEDAKALIDTTPDIVIIDVSGVYDKGHLPGAINYYIGNGSLDEAIPDLDPEKTYLVYCHSVSASTAGAQKLVDAGFEKVYRLQGNYRAWLDAGYPIET